MRCRVSSLRDGLGSNRPWLRLSRRRGSEGRAAHEAPALASIARSSCPARESQRLRGPRQGAQPWTTRGRVGSDQRLNIMPQRKRAQPDSGRLSRNEEALPSGGPAPRGQTVRSVSTAGEKESSGGATAAGMSRRGPTLGMASPAISETPPTGTFCFARRISISPSALGAGALLQKSSQWQDGEGG
jgi:hypothetical protein